MNSKIWILILATISLLLVFQNCGRLSTEHQSLAVASSVFGKANEDSYFSYPYSRPPEYYETALLLKPNDEIQKFLNLTIFVSLTKSDGTTGGLVYEVLLQDKNGFPVCPRKQGSLLVGQTSIQFECTAANDPDAVTLIVNYGAVATTQHQFKKAF